MKFSCKNRIVLQLREASQMSKAIRSIKKVAKKIVKSPVFRVALAAVAIYTGGAALGLWKAAGTLGRVNGILAGAGKAAPALNQAASTTALTGAAAPSSLATISATGKALPTVLGSSPASVAASAPAATGGMLSKFAG